jgi:hypothetical protein
MKLSTLTRSLINSLLDRAEQPDRQTVVRVRLNQREHRSYYASDDSTARRECHHELGDLAAQGLIRLLWRKWEEGNWLEAVDLLPEGSQALYQLLKRSPRTHQQALLEQQLGALQTQSRWLGSFVEWTRVQLAAHRSIAPLKLDDSQHNADLLKALTAIAELATPTLERSLSTRLFGNSKRLEGLRSAILSVLRRHDPAAQEFGDDDWALLRSHKLDRAPEYLALAGSLTLELHTGEQIALGAIEPSIALSAASLANIQALQSQADCLITVENATSFNELVLQRPPNCLLIYTGGFASPSLIDLLGRIRSAHPNLLHYHWGDLDAGGLAILLHLRNRLGPVQTLAMDTASFSAHQGFAQALTQSDRKRLTELRQQELLNDCIELIDLLLFNNNKLEQEAIDPNWVMNG